MRPQAGKGEGKGDGRGQGDRLRPAVPAPADAGRELGPRQLCGAGERGQARELLCVLGQAGQVPGEGMRAWKKASGGAGCLATGRGPCVETADIIPGRGLPVKRAAPGKGEDGIWE
ncbi:MAG: hypothetical protein HFG19_01320 [Oscillospiraceae bacterium]|nr:hypothetical protein [Oscillospiraceae bacterium]